MHCSLNSPLNNNSTDTAKNFRQKNTKMSEKRFVGRTIREILKIFRQKKRLFLHSKRLMAYIEVTTVIDKEHRDTTKNGQRSSQSTINADI